MRRPSYQIKIARERIQILFDEARKIISEDKNLANRYIQLARKIGMRYNVRFPRELKRKVCKRCKSFLQPSVTCKVRVKRGFVKIKCFSCGKIIHYPYKSKKIIKA